MARRKKSTKQRLKGNLRREPRSFKQGKEHLLCILLVNFYDEAAGYYARGRSGMVFSEVWGGAAAIEVQVWPLLARHRLFFSASV